jgi:hypothetical protein
MYGVYGRVFLGVGGVCSYTLVFVLSSFSLMKAQ